MQNRKEKKIFPSCYAKKMSDSKVAIFHFKELLKKPELEDSDVKRKNTIVWLLIKWNLIKITDEKTKQEVTSNMLQKKIFILPKKQKDDEKWEVVHKFHFEGRNLKTDGGV